VRRGLLASALSRGAFLTIGASAWSAIEGFPGAGEPIEAKLDRTFPGSQDHFVNCPGNNRIDLKAEEEGLVCEFRLVRHGGVIGGTASVAADRSRWERARWHLLDLKVLPRAPLDWRHCRTGRISGSAQFRHQLRVFGVAYQTAVPLAQAISRRANTATNLRIPRKFVEAEQGNNTLGFLTTRFRCRGRIEVRQGKPNPYGHETANCRTRFGDRFAYSFDQGS
jgi:hypothetical protein